MEMKDKKFNDLQKQILKKYVSNVDKNIFVLKNLPEVVKGALFSKYSRSYLSLKELLLKEFIIEKEKNRNEREKSLNVKKANDFYERILDGYGDDSIGELGGAHLAFENISILCAKEIEDCRIGGSFLEKSTRYIYFDEKVNGKYLFYEEPILMTSAYREKYIETCNFLFDTYKKLIPILTKKMEEKIPKELNVSLSAYKTALRAKVLDCLRGLLPTSTLTNVGVFGNGRFFESLLRKLCCSSLQESRDVGKDAFDELSKEIFPFIKRASSTNKHFESYMNFSDKMKADLKMLSDVHKINFEKDVNKTVTLVRFEKNSALKVASHLIFGNSNASIEDIFDYVKSLSKEEIERILDATSMYRENRRHKSPRALETVSFTFEIIADFGVYRDLQRHRLLTQEKQLLTCDLNYFIPFEIKGSDMEKDYRDAMQRAKETFEEIAKEFPEEAQYVVPMAYKIRWLFHINLRQLQWLTELRSSAAGHPSYRYIAQEMAKLVCKKIPEFERFFKFVDFDGHEIGRLQQEIRKEKKVNV